MGSKGVFVIRTCFRDGDDTLVQFSNLQDFPPAPFARSYRATD